MPSADRVPSAAPHQLPFYAPHASRMDGASPNSIGTRDEEKGSLDFTQRIERKLAEYNASQSIFKRWLFEVLSWCVSATSMAAVVGIYVHLKDQPISSSRSAVLLMMANVLGKVASAALIVPTTEALGQLKWNWFHKSNAMWDFEIFDKATRGPWGAAMLLFRTKGRSLAALGALLIVLLLAIDTFFQQVVDLPERWSLESAVSKLPVTVHYDPGTTDQYRDWIPSATSDPDLFHVVEKFSYGNGTQPVPFGNGTRPDIPLSCPTSKCTWPVYETLGICSECADVSEHLSYACVSNRIDWTANSTGGFTSEGFFPNATVCGYFLNATEASPILMSGHVVDANATRRGEALIMRSLPLTSLLTKEPLYGNGSINFKEMRNTIVDIVIVSASQGTAETVYRKVPPIAQECVLSWCVKTIESSYDFGVYEERVIETHLNTTPGAFPWIGYPFVDELGGGTDIFFLQDINIAGITSDGRTFSGYGTENSTAMSVIQGFNDIFPAFATVNATFSDPVLRYRIWKEGPAYNRLLEFNPWLAPNNVSRHMERLANALTNVVRSAPSNAMLTGQAFSIETYVDIHWAWLAFPFTLLVLSLIFLVATMLKTSRGDSVGVWKTSAMPTLIYGLPQDVRTQVSSSETHDHLSWKGARKVRIKLLPDQGWRISRQVCTSPAGEETTVT
ncbi:hypothetical protein HBH52_052100 [Parastagonospora nodorum]|nr:hypothetical protein HBH52_052100 [Parastagonospora nodorum]KAH5364352.1 hypothetical protein HBI48_076210 [Parastagonospora nodorum]